MVSQFDNTYKSLDVLCRMCDEKKVKVIVDSVHPLTTEGVRAAVALLMSSRARGKIVLKV